MLLFYLTFMFLGLVSNLDFSTYLLYGLCSFASIYLIVRFLAEKYIFRKIKLVYKVISDSKNSMKDMEFASNNKNSLEAVNDIAVEWTKNTEKEIAFLKSLEKYRKNFLGDVSHEMKTPLFSIQGYLMTLLDGGIYDEKINIKYLQKATQNVDRLQAIVEDLEMINMLESEDKVLDISTFDIKKLTQSVYEDLAFMANEKKIELLFKPGAEHPYKVTADKNKIRQVLANLISNSIKYGKENGRTKASFYDMDERILIEISDDGIGIPENDIKHVYDRFYRADKSRNRNVGGSGLGLAIVKHIIEAHDQNLSVRSTDGIGSTFGFTVAKK